MTLFFPTDARRARPTIEVASQEDKHMNSALLAASPARRDSVQVRMTYGLIYPLCLVAQGFSRLLARLPSEDPEARPSPRSLFDDARADASIATSYALMAWTMLHSSGRDSRPERLS